MIFNYIFDVMGLTKHDLVIDFDTNITLICLCLAMIGSELRTVRTRSMGSFLVDPCINDIISGRYNVG